jgi:hypothetical protein
LCALLADLASAATIRTWVVAPAGGTRSADWKTTHSTFGQVAAGTVQSSTLHASVGYWPFEVGGSATTAVETSGGAPLAFRCYGAAPNPFRRAARIAFDVPSDGAPVQLQIYDASGRLVRSLVNGDRPAGRQEATWDSRDDGGTPLGSGVYFARLRVGPHHASQKLLLVR